MERLSGYYLQGELPYRDDNLVVFAWSPAIRNFDHWQLVPIRVV